MSVKCSIIDREWPYFVGFGITVTLIYTYLTSLLGFDIFTSNLVFTTLFPLLCLSAVSLDKRAPFDDSVEKDKPVLIVKIPLFTTFLSISILTIYACIWFLQHIWPIPAFNQHYNEGFARRQVRLKVKSIKDEVCKPVGFPSQDPSISLFDFESGSAVDLSSSD